MRVAAVVRAGLLRLHLNRHVSRVARQGSRTRSTNRHSPWHTSPLHAPVCHARWRLTTIPDSHPLICHETWRFPAGHLQRQGRNGRERLWALARDSEALARDFGLSRETAGRHRESLVTLTRLGTEGLLVQPGNCRVHRLHQAGTTASSRAGPAGWRVTHKSHCPCGARVAAALVPPRLSYLPQHRTYARMGPP